MKQILTLIFIIASKYLLAQSCIGFNQKAVIDVYTNNTNFTFVTTHNVEAKFGNKIIFELYNIATEQWLTLEYMFNEENKCIQYTRIASVIYYNYSYDYFINNFNQIGVDEFMGEDGVKWKFRALNGANFYEIVAHL